MMVAFSVNYNILERCYIALLNVINKNLRIYDKKLQIK